MTTVFRLPSWNKGWPMRILALLLLAGWVPAADPAFTIVVDTSNAGTSPSNAFTLPLDYNAQYNCTIAWGDSTSSLIVMSISPTHVYPSAGTYTISITENVPGGFPTIAFNNGGDRLKLMQISNWGSVTWSSMHGAFYGCSNLTITATDQATANTGSVLDFTYAWAGCVSLTSFPLLDTSSGTSFAAAWDNCSGLTSFPAIDTSSGTSFLYAWNGCFGLTSFPLLATGQVTDFSNAWDDCNKLTSFPAIDTSSGTDFTYAWASCTGLTAFPAIDTSQGTTFTGTWLGCTGLTSFPTLNLGSMIYGNQCFNGDTLSTGSYSSLLIALAAQNANTGVTFTGGNSQYAAGAAATARNTTLIADLGWTITDGGEAAAAQSAFTLVINTAVPAGLNQQSGTNQFTLPLNSSYAYDCTVDWGDSTNSLITTSTSPTHTYYSPGIYTVAITENVSGGFPAIFFNGGGDCLKVSAIANWGASPGAR